MSTRNNAIIFVPGILPKPPAEQHRNALWQCMTEGVRRVNPQVARELASDSEFFELVPWSPLFYGEHRDIEVDREGIQQLLEQAEPTKQDIRDARTWGRRMSRLVFAIGDLFPPLTDIIANERLAERLKEIRRYFHNSGGQATKIRDLVTDHIRRAWDDDKRVMLIGHSFGSIIAYDTLWELSRVINDSRKIDLFVTMGSPMALKFVRRRIKGANESGSRRFPANIRHWLNITALGEAATLDKKFVESFSEMLELQLVETITDHMELVNFFRGPDGLNVHKCYGYFASRDTGRFIAEWWQERA